MGSEMLRGVYTEHSECAQHDWAGALCCHPERSEGSLRISLTICLISVTLRPSRRRIRREYMPMEETEYALTATRFRLSLWPCLRRCARCAGRISQCKRNPDDPVAALRRAAVTAGDSDSIACLTGAFAGAYHGFGAWPKEWINRIEYAGRLAMLGSLWD